MKKIFKLFVVAIIIGASVFILSGCGRYKSTKKQIEKIRNEIETVDNAMERINEIDKERENMKSINEIANEAKRNAISNSTTDSTN